MLRQCSYQVFTCTFRHIRCFPDWLVRRYHFHCRGDTVPSSLFANSSYWKNARSCSLLLSRQMATSSDSTSVTPPGVQKRNRLAQEKSPYLLQHASNPVNWFPWGKEAFETAKSQNKPIFLSVGYSTCHWCHVMERESFENEEIGAILNEHFVSIKVDREERPDVDKVYMTFIQATSGGGGWPMSVWLTPDLNPIFGGTYFPPDDRYYGRPGFKTLLNAIAKQWKEKHAKINEQGNAIIDALKSGTEVKAETGQSLPGPEVIHKCYTSLSRSYDAELGGFNKEPKFPQPCNFNLLFRMYRQDQKSETGKRALEMALHTLRMMAKGGIHDHVAQGFHRYSTDRKWHVPHFEKMLYDQAQLAVAYSEAYQITKDEVFADVARDILLYVSRDLSDKSGGFYSAEDADSHPSHDLPEKQEGAFCVWTHQEIHSLLNQPIEGSDGLILADVFCKHYSVQENGNVDPYQDPHDELKNQNVLMVQDSVEETAGHFKLDVSKIIQLLQQAREILYDVRKKRPPPHLDNKMLTAWNGLMLSGFARAGQALQDSQYTDRAMKAAEFIHAHLYDNHSGKLLRSCYVDPVTQTIAQISEPVSGFLDDYAFLIQGLLDLYEACYDTRWLQWAEQLQNQQDAFFLDHENGGYYMCDAADSSIVMRMKDDQDGAEPSANSVSALNLLRLANFLDEQKFRHQSEKLVTLFSQRLREIPVALPQMLCALMFLQQTPKQIIIRGDADCEDTDAMLRCVHSQFIPHKVLILARGQEDAYLYDKLPILASLTKQDDKATAYVCENYSCSLPTVSMENLKKLLYKSGSCKL